MNALQSEKDRDWYFLTKMGHPHEVNYHLTSMSVDSSYYLNNLYWQKANNPALLVIVPYIWWSSMYCNFHDIRVTWIADVSLLVNESRSYDLWTDLRVFSCTNRCWCFPCCLFGRCSTIFLLDSLIPTHLLLYTHTHMHLYTEKDSPLALSRTRRWQSWCYEYMPVIYNVICDTMSLSCLL